MRRGGNMAVDFAQGSFQPRPDGADRNFARRSFLRQAWIRETVRCSGTSKRGEPILRQRAVRRFRRVRVDLKAECGLCLFTPSFEGQAAMNRVRALLTARDKK